MTHPLEPMLRPNSVAIIGASDTESRIGGRPIHSMKTLGFAGDIYPINPKRETIQGLPAFASIKDVPRGIDCAVIAVPAKVAVDVVRDCADHGVKSAVMFTSGFAELSDDGAKAQAEITGIARESGMRLIGPNCLVFLMFSMAGTALLPMRPACCACHMDRSGLSARAALMAPMFLWSRKCAVWRPITG